MSHESVAREKPLALSLLSSQRPRNVGWRQAAGLLFGDWGTSRLYVLGLAFLFAGRTSFWLILLMSLLIVAVGWAYTQICRIYPDGGGVYTAAKNKSRTLAIVGALLLFADYTVTASLSSLEAFHYFGLPVQKHQLIAESKIAPERIKDAGEALILHPRTEDSPATGALLAWDSPGLWAIVAIVALGLFNLLGPRHTAGFAIFAALGMIAITLLIVGFAVPRIDWSRLPERIGHLNHAPGDLWRSFVYIVLALSGVEAIANLTGVMKRPVAHTARGAIWIVTLEVAIFNLLLTAAMVSIFPLSRDAHTNDMLAYLTSYYVGGWGEWLVRIIGGLLLLSATNTAVNGLMSIVYIVSRDGELPVIFQKVNRFGSPWVAAILAGGVPILILVISHDLEALAALYAIGVIGAIAINVTLCSVHPRLRRLHRKAPMLLLGIVLLAIWITLATTKLHALVFVGIVLAIGLTARAATRWHARRRGDQTTLIRRAIQEQLSPEALGKPKILVGTYGSVALAPMALREAKRTNHALVVCFVRELSLSYKFNSAEKRLTIDTDLAAQRAFVRYLDWGHAMGVTVLPVYDTGPNAAELMAENAALYGCDRVLLGTSRRGALHRLVKGRFQHRLESILPPEVHVEVVKPVVCVDELPAELPQVAPEDLS